MAPRNAQVVIYPLGERDESLVGCTNRFVGTCILCGIRISTTVVSCTTIARGFSHTIDLRSVDFECAAFQHVRLHFLVCDSIDSNWIASYESKCQSRKINTWREERERGGVFLRLFPVINYSNYHIIRRFQIDSLFVSSMGNGFEG